MSDIIPEGTDDVADLRDRWLRAEAEIANVRNRARRDVDDARQHAVQKFAIDIVEGVENLKRGLDSLPPISGGEQAITTVLRDGFADIDRSFVALLKRHGVTRKEALGAVFNPHLHQAMVEQETSAASPGTVIKVLSSGWMLHGRLLRPAMVVVAKAPSSTTTPQGKTP
jgi:molecular chaperone GrpE